MGKKARFYNASGSDDNAVTCTACAFRCRIRDGKTGLCGVRHNDGGILYNDTYGLLAAFGIDPIEKKPLFHFKPGQQALSLGTVGCNFDCDFCQNASLSQCTKNTPSPEKVINHNSYSITSDDVINLCKTKSIPIIAYTYNEPIINIEYILETAQKARKNNIKNVMITNGYHSKDSREALAHVLDAVNIDLKSFSKDFYAKRCKAQLQPVLDTIRYYHENNVFVELTTLIIPDENDSEEELKQIASFIAGIDPDIPWHISAFQPQHRMSDHKPTSTEKLKKAYNIGKEQGLHHIYAGNVYEPEFTATYCPECASKIIKRQPFLEGAINGTCPECGHKLKGVW